MNFNPLYETKVSILLPVIYYDRASYAATNEYGPVG